MHRYDYVLFDFDGTISRSAEGVRRCVELTLREMGRPCPDLSDYSRYIGPPLTMTFRELCGLSHEDSLRALPIYRRYYNRVGLEMNSFFDGVEATLRALRDAGLRMAVCTSKNEALALRSMQLIGADGYFDAVCGSCDDGSRKEKIDLIPYALQTLGCADRRRAVMIGDTHFDTAGAVACGVDFLGVLYGYGTRETMAAAGAEHFVDTPQELLSYIL